MHDDGRTWATPATTTNNVPHRVDVEESWKSQYRYGCVKAVSGESQAPCIIQRLGEHSDGAADSGWKRGFL